MQVHPSLNSISAQVIFDSAVKKGVTVEVISSRFNLFKLIYKEKFLFVKSTSLPVNPQPSCAIANNKYLTKKILEAQGILMPQGWLVSTQQEARDLILEKDIFPCVLKPARGAHGRHVYANIESMAEFEHLLPLVFSGHAVKNVLIEEHISGHDYRLLVTGNKVSAVMERIPARVVGDGVNTISQLISIFNKSPLVGKKYERPLCKIVMNGEVSRNLQKLSKNFTDVLEEGETVFLRQNANISTGGTGHDVTDSVCQSVKDIAIAATKAIGMVISGVDIIYNETSKKAYVLEINDTPGIDIHHYPVAGVPRLVADDIVDNLIEQLKV